MRAETQSLVDDIEKSLELLRARIGWEDAELRLEEIWFQSCHSSAQDGYNCICRGPICRWCSDWSSKRLVFLFPFFVLLFSGQEP